MGFLAKTFGLTGLDAQPSDGPTGDYSANVMPPPRDRSPFVKVDQAVTLIPIYRGIQIVTDLGSQLTLNGFRWGQMIDPTPSLLVQPDPWRPLDSFIERYIVSLIADGNAFLRKFLGPDQRTVAATEVLNPFKVEVVWKDGVKSYRYATDKGTITLRHEEVVHIWWLEIPGRTRGIGPLQAAGMDLAGWLDLREFAAGWFEDSDVPSGVLSSDQALDPAAVAMYRKVWRNPAAFDDEAEKVSSRVGPSVRVLGKGLSYDPIRLNPEEAQYLGIQRDAVLQAARMLGLPADYLLAAVEGKSMTYTNLEMIEGQFIRITLFPRYLRKLQSALSSMLPNGQTAAVSYGDLGKPDSKTQAEIDKTYVELGVYDEDHVRKRIGIPGRAPGRKAAPAPVPDDAGDPA